MKTFGFIAAALGILLFAALTLIVAPMIQLAQQNPEPDLKPYTEAELQGRKIYVENGCFYCHSQQPRDPSYGSDQKRNWGRASTPGDYAYDRPHLLGTMRTGPDLLNIGVRQPSIDWHLVHLYQPRAVLPGSIMPSYPFLFELKKQIHPDDYLVNVPKEWVPQGYQVVARPEALALVRYLQSLKRNYPPTQQKFRERKNQ